MASSSSGVDSSVHHDLLKVHCRICGQKRVDAANNRGVPIKVHPQLCRWLRYLHDIEVERESSEIYPTRACEVCISKLRNVSICMKGTTRMALENVFELATKLHTDGQDEDMRKLARQFPAADFWAHSSAGMCAICDDTQKDTFPSDDPNKLCLLIEVEDDSGVFKISAFSRTEKMVVPKRDVKEAVPVISTKSSATAVTITIDDAPAKKARVTPDEPSSSTATPVPGAKANSLSAGLAWTQFNEALGRNRRSRCDKLSELLRWSNAENPKIISDLKASGIDYAMTSTRHFTPNVEYKSTLAKSKRLLMAFQAAKRTLILFRAITDTVTDGRLELLSHVGIHINLKHANMAFLVRKIKAKQAAANPPPATVARPPGRPSRVVPARSKGNTTQGNNKNDLLSKVPSSITISKIKKSDNPNSIPSSSSRSSKVYHDAEESPSPGAQNQSMILERAPEAVDESTDEIVLSEKKIWKAVNDIEKKHLPANRQMKTDVVYDCLHLRADAPSLLASHGIIYNPKLGKHHLRVLSGQRKVHKTAIMKVTESLSKYEWAAVMAQIIFGLLHTEDTLTLRVAGIMIDPFHEAAPLSFRMGFMLKHLLISKEDPSSSRTLLTQVLKACDIDAQAYDNKAIEDALIQLLYCDRSEAQNLLSATKKPIKISLKSNKTGGNLYVPSLNASKPSTSKGPRARKIIYKDDPFDEDEEEEEKITPTKTTRRGRPVIKREKGDSDYVPKVKVKASPSPASTRGKGNKSGSIRGPYRKSSKQLAKEKAKVIESLTWSPNSSSLEPNVLVEVNSDMLDPLAMPDPAFVNPMDVTIKAEIIDDIPAVDDTESSMVVVNDEGEQLTSVIEAHEDPVIADDPIDSGPGLFISSVTGNAHDLDDASTDPVDIGPNPLLDEPMEVTSDKDVPTSNKGTDEIPKETAKAIDEGPTTVEATVEKDPIMETEEEVSASGEASQFINLATNERDESRQSPCNNSNSVDCHGANGVDVANSQTSNDPLSAYLTNDESSANSVEIEDPFGGSEMSLPTSESQVASEAFPPAITNGGGATASDPFEGSSQNDPFTSGEELESNINDLLLTNPAVNGEANPPTLLDDEANDLLDQLVNFQTTHKGMSTDEQQQPSSNS